MLYEKRFKTNVGVGIGSVLQLAGFFLVETVETAKVAGLVLILISLPVFVWGCMHYAEGKGYSKSVGLLGLCGIIGLIVLIVLPERGQRQFGSYLGTCGGRTVHDCRICPCHIWNCGRPEALWQC